MNYTSKLKAILEEVIIMEEENECCAEEGLAAAYEESYIEERKAEYHEIATAAFIEKKWDAVREELGLPIGCWLTI